MLCDLLFFYPNILVFIALQMGTSSHTEDPFFHSSLKEILHMFKSSESNVMRCRVLCGYHAARAQEKRFREQTNKTPSALTNNLGSITSIIQNVFPVYCRSSKRKQRLVLNVQWFSNDLRRERKHDKDGVSLN